MFLIFPGIKNLKICQSVTKLNSTAARKAQAPSNQHITSCRYRCRSQSSHFTGYSKGLAQKYYGTVFSIFIHVKEHRKLPAVFTWVLFFACSLSVNIIHRYV